ncbi:endopeptidase La [bacterium]|nr:endopeptidase La [bacterium]
MSKPTNIFIPVVPIRNTVLFPGTALPLKVGRSKSIGAVEKARASDGWILVVTQKDADEANDPRSDGLYKVGTLAKLEKSRASGDKGYEVIARGVSRFRIDEFKLERDHLTARGEEWEDIHDSDAQTEEVLIKSLKKLSKDILNLLPADTEQLIELVDGIEDLSFLTHLCAANIDVPTVKKQEILETPSIKNRSLSLLEVLQHQKETLTLQNEIRDKLSQKMGKAHRESILREQMRTIREELGEEGDSKDQNNYRKKIDESGMPESARKVADEELKRLEGMGNSSPESHVIRTYLDLLCSLPWAKYADETIDLDQARAVLEGDHYGLDKVKKRILEHLAVMKLKKESRGTILLLVGPPGVGKTSLGQSIAHALGRKFVRGSLGGVRDDAEIRGHRRTYIGALPGRIIQAIKRAGESNPVFLLDEVDKLSRSFVGDPASALLEVLDPEQNKTFLDHYLDIPYDLSRVFFIATANTLDSIPGPLLDRMEVIDLTGYTTAEKLHIAKNHLLPKQLKEHGIQESLFSISDAAILRTISHYTREAGVRDLQRKIAAICRASTERILEALQTPEADRKPIRVDVADLEKILGPERFIQEVAEGVTSPGVVTGLAWTPVGGEILFVEASQMPGTGKLTLTGQLGDVMKESAQIALSLVRSHVSEIASTFKFNKSDIHIHVPAGAIPKDGPSAGVTMLTTIASLLSGRSVNPKLAMTGEITLRGAVMPVGGIKEKVIAAHRAGIERIIMSKRNQKDLVDVPEDVKAQLKFHFVENYAEVLEVALGIKAKELDQFLPQPPPQQPPAAVM